LDFDAAAIGFITNSKLRQDVERCRGVEQDVDHIAASLASTARYSSGTAASSTRRIGR
jgi:hypothetical protein